MPFSWNADSQLNSEGRDPTETILYAEENVCKQLPMQKVEKEYFVTNIYLLQAEIKTNQPNKPISHSNDYPEDSISSQDKHRLMNINNTTNIKCKSEHAALH